MRLLAVDACTKCASAALWDGGAIKAELFIDNGRTHSRTLLPMIDSVLRAGDVSLPDIDLLCVTNGPGSFTGVRIGVACVKGLAQANSTPCMGVSSLLAAAYGCAHVNGYVCALLDARRNQFYTALFKCKDGAVIRQTEDGALSAEKIKNIVEGLDEPVFLVGDGAVLWYNYLRSVDSDCTNVTVAPPALVNIRASGAAAAAARAIENGEKSVDAAELGISYLRLPQAERERLKKAAECDGSVKKESDVR